jgi:hypothetical protein
MRIQNTCLFGALWLLKISHSTPLGPQPGLQAPLEDLAGDHEHKEQASSRQLHGRFLHITGKQDSMPSGAF